MCLSSAWTLCRFAFLPRVKSEFPTLAYETRRAVAPAFLAHPLSYILCFALCAPRPHRLFLEKSRALSCCLLFFLSLEYSSSGSSCGWSLAFQVLV